MGESDGRPETKRAGHSIARMIVIAMSFAMVFAVAVSLAWRGGGAAG